MSYECCIEIKGTEESILQMLNNITSKEAGKNKKILIFNIAIVVCIKLDLEISLVQWPRGSEFGLCSVRR